MARAKSERALFIIGAIVVLIVALYAVSRMPFVREIVLKYKELELKVVAGEIKEAERHYQENLKTRPSVHLASTAGRAENGIRAKMEFLASELYQAEVTLASAKPALAPRILRSRSLAERIREYRSDEAAETAMLRGIAQRLDQYSTLLRIFSEKHVSAVLLLAKDAPASEQVAQVTGVMQSILSDPTLAQSGSAYNLLGNLAFALDRRERVFEYLYRAYLNDPEHLPTLESLGYALWKLNGDCLNAMSYTTEGYQLAWAQMTVFGGREKGILAELVSLKSNRPSIARLAEARAVEVSRFFAEHEKEVAAYLKDEYDRLRDTSVYCMAFERVTEQEAEARAIAEDLVKSDPTDPDFMDTKGFVLLRFQKSTDEIRQAVELFRTSSLKAQDSHEKELAEHHLVLARKLLQVAE